MKLTVQHHHLRSSDELDSLIENRILALQPRLQIDEANVQLACSLEESPAFSVRVHLVTPGPDARAGRIGDGRRRGDSRNRIHLGAAGVAQSQRHSGSRAA